MKSYCKQLIRPWVAAVGAVSMCLSLGCGTRDEAAVEPNAGGNSGLEGDSGSEVVVFTWEEYFSPDVVAAFEEETGIEVKFEYFENLEEMKALIQSNPDAYDLAIADDMTLTELTELKLLKPIDRAVVPSFENLDEKYLNHVFDPGNEYSVPYTWGTTLVAFRSDRIQDPDPSWSLLWQEEFKGRVLMLNEKQDIYASALLSLGLPMNSDDPAELESATQKLLEQVEKVDARFVSLEEAKDAIMSGDCWAFMAYSGDAAVIAAEDENISYFIPKEGAPIWLDSFVIPREAVNVAEAHAFVEYLSRPEPAAENANYLWYATPNKAAIGHLNAELRGDRNVFPEPEVVEKCEFISTLSPLRDRITNAGMKRLFDRIRTTRLAAD